MNYIVECSYTGGITGSNRGPLRKDKQVVYFETFEEADAEAKRLQAQSDARKDANPHIIADFRYRAREA